MKQPGSFLSKSSSYILVLIFAVVLFFKYLSNQNNNPASHQNSIPINARLIFTKHAKCRMDCRHIDESEIRKIIGNGEVNEQTQIQMMSLAPQLQLKEHRMITHNSELFFPNVMMKLK